MKRIIFILIISLALISCGKKEKNIVKEVAEFTGSKYVSLATVISSDIQSYLEYSGKLTAVQINDIAPQIPQKIEKIYIKENDFVQKGDTLIAFDRNTIAQLKANYDNVQKNYDRSKELLKNQVIDQKTFDDIELLYTSTKANYETSMHSLLITAPFSGIVTNITQKEGENYSPMMNAAGINGLLRIVNLSEMKAEIAVTDFDLNKIKKGQRVIVHTDLNPEKDYHGTVSRLSSSANALSGLYQCEITVNNINNELKNNQFARIKIINQKASNALIIPIKAILEDNSVYIVEDGKAYKRELTLGIINKDYAQVLEGLALGDSVIVEGNVGIVDGVSVVVR